MPPCDPSPYATIARKLREARAHNAPHIEAERVRSRHALTRFLERNAPSSEAARARDARMHEATSANETFRAQAGADYAYATPKHKPT